MNVSASEKGAAVVEFAILALLLLVFVFGIIEFGFLWLQANYIANAAREGGRVASKLEDPLSGSEVQTAVQNYLKGTVVYSDDFVNDCCGNNQNIKISIDSTDITATGVPDPIKAWDVTVSVQTSRIWKPVLWRLLNLFPGVSMGDINQLSESAVFAAKPGS